MQDNIGRRLLERLGLYDHFPKKMKTLDILMIDMSCLEECQPSSEQALPRFFLQKLLILDYRAKDVCCKLNSNAKQKQRSIPVLKENLNVKTFFCESPFDKHMTIQDEMDLIHPMDIQMAIFYCSDIFLWQYIATQLSFCQYALPLLVPNPFTVSLEFPSWSFVHLQKSWAYSENSDNQTGTIKYKSHSLYEAELPTISFIRFSRSTLSKSHIINALINNQKHNTFFHRNCKGSSARSIFMDGVVEISWYFPCGKDDDILNKCVAFTNLHGDARKHEKQFKFLLQTATIHVVFLTKTDQKDEGSILLQQLLDSSSPLICICSDIKEDSFNQDLTKYMIGAEGKNTVDIVTKLVENVRYLIRTLQHGPSIMSLTVNAKELNILIDEDNEDWRKGKYLGDTLLSKIKNCNLADIKNKYFPLQGDQLWHEWCKQNKELNVLRPDGHISLEEHVCNIKEEKNRIRRMQYEKAFPLNDVIETFLSNMKEQSTEYRAYQVKAKATTCDATQRFFLKFLEISLYALTSDQIVMLDEKLHIKWNEMQKLKQNGANIQTEIDELLNKRNASVISVEHIIRELGQMYEACESQSSNDDCINYLPDIVANMMISGYPIELMDGNASHVPLEWISAVLKKVTHKIGDKTVFVLSVLGIQSSGKSTLLNAMFGLQFPVSAGKCTRGAFMQLIAVKEMNNGKKFDYILVVDTEGLRSLELGIETLNRDNELATFVVGIGNLTLINIFGENPSEMQDVLQIVVQAFMRMKQVRLSPSCIFVHQNVSEITAGDKNMEGKRRLLEKLDKMSYTAAKQELRDVNGFSDVIRFDVNTHIHYFSHLWEGNPPMAPVNPCYSENVLNLKRMILSFASTQDLLKISEISVRVQDLWNALLAENFIFSFKNTLEILAYRKLEQKCGEWTWKLRSTMHEIENKCINLLENRSIELVDETFFESSLQKEYQTITDDKDRFFKEDNDKEIMIQWKIYIEKRLFTIKEELIEETKRNCIELARLKKSCRDLDDKKNMHENELMKRSQKLALELKTKGLTEEQLHIEFNKLWSDWENQVSSDMTTVRTKKNVKLDIERILSQRFKGDHVNLTMQNSTYEQLSSRCDFAMYIHKNNAFWKQVKASINGVANVMYSEEDTLNKAAKDLTDNIIRKIDKYVEEKKRSRFDYNETFIHEILNIIQTRIADFENNETRFSFRKEFTMDLSFMLCLKAAPTLQQMHNAFRSANDPLIYLKSKKDAYFELFRAVCNDAISITVFAEFIGSKLKEAIRQAVCNKSAIDIAGDMRCKEPAFKTNRYDLENHILRALAKEEDFSKYMKYINFPKEHFKEFINQSVENYCWDVEQSRMQQVFKYNLDSFKSSILCKISKATEDVQSKKGEVQSMEGNVQHPEDDVSKWLNAFCSELTNELQFTRNDVKFFKCMDISDISFLKEVMTKVLQSVVEELRTYFTTPSHIGNYPFRKTPQEILVEEFSGCWEQCPFCNAICTNKFNGHQRDDHRNDHCVTLHRPNCIIGVGWKETDNFCIEICSSLVASDYYFVFSYDKYISCKDYRTAGPAHNTWSITPDNSSHAYWKWFVCRFKSDLEKTYSKKFSGMGAIPKQWEKITQHDAIGSLLIRTDE